MECVEKVYLDDETGDYVATKYFINGIEVDEEEYCEYLDADIVDDNDDNDEDDEYECDGNCDACESTCEEGVYIHEDEDDEEDFITFTDIDSADEFIDMIEEYSLLLEETGGCPSCIRKILVEFAKDFSDTFGETEE